MLGDKKVIKWCNGYGNKWKMNWNGGLLGLDPEYYVNGQILPSG
jgi:hypothetical protein